VAADGKRLIITNFFRKAGTDEQRTMRGLLRGVVHDVLRSCPDIAKSVFPELWDPRRYSSPLMVQTPEPSISTFQVQAAFKRLLHCEDISTNFKTCLFIDKPDEFHEPIESLSSFSSKLSK
jgi:hypothetical protein